MLVVEGAPDKLEHNGRFAHAPCEQQAGRQPARGGGASGSAKHARAGPSAARRHTTGEGGGAARAFAAKTAPSPNSTSLKLALAAAAMLLPALRAP